jgi:hypothetical protein
MNLQLRGKVVQLVNNYDTSLFNDIFSKIKNIFKNLTEEQAISIANNISQINAPGIRLYGNSDIGNWKIPIIINDKEKLNLVNTNNQEKIYYINQEPPLVVKVNEDFNPILNNGEYIYLNVGDNFGNSQNLYKNIAKDVIIGILTQSGYIQLQKQNFGQDLQQAPAINLEIDNQTNSIFKIRLESQYATKNLEDILPNTVKNEQIIPFTNWNYFYLYWRANLTNETQTIILELWKADMSQLIATTYAYAGNNYQGWNWISQIYPSNYNIQDYKLIIKYQ